MAASQQRLFVALWPDAQTRGQIAAVQKQVMTRAGLLDGAVAFDNLHLTLLFLGNVASADITRLQNHLSRVASTPFHLMLDRWGQFSKPGILWIGPQQTPTPLQQLHSDVVAACRDVVRVRESQYIPHVTLFRKLQQLPPVEAFEPVAWLVDRFVLVASNTRPQGVQYRVLQEFLF